MAKQNDATPSAVKPATYEWDLDGLKVTMPLFGPYGDKALHGTKLEYELVQSNREKRLKGDPDATLDRTTFVKGVDYWVTCAWVPESDERVKAFANAKPANVGVLITKALCTAARQASWHANRGGNTTLYVSVNGLAPKAVDVALVDIMRKGGATVVEVPRPARKVKATK